MSPSRSPGEENDTGDFLPANDTAQRGGGERRRRPRWKTIGIALLAIIVLAMPLWAPLLMRRMDFFRLRRVEVVGTNYMTVDEVLAVLQVDTMMSVWDATSPMRKRVEAHPEVLEAKVKRKMPGTIVVEVSERIPIALVAGPEGFRIFDERGVALPIDPTRAPVDAPVIDRPDTTLLRLLADVRVRLPQLYAQTSEVRRRENQRDELLLRLDTIPVRTMSDVTIERLAELEAVAADLARRGVHPREIDLRYKDQVIARLQ
jgi:cell division septal protein FtsQ